MIDEYPVSFDCEGDRLTGIVSLPVQPATRGVLIVVGGPQYRVGSHRQFTLLARSLAARGIAAMRFDQRGMGDSEGTPPGFEHIGADIRAALDCFVATVPGLNNIALWGLCDGASAIAFYGADDVRVQGLALLNPWIRTESGAARATIKHYYRARLFDRALWVKVLRGRLDLRAALLSALGVARSALRPHPDEAPADDLSDRVLDGLARFKGRVLVMLSGADLTAQEFADLSGHDPRWKRLLDNPRLTRRDLPGADHTCSRRVWHEQVVDWTCNWMSER